jgi:tetratricopeptide (TPR) repeat protein
MPKPVRPWTLVFIVITQLSYGLEGSLATESEPDRIRENLYDLAYGGHNENGQFKFDCTLESLTQALEISDRLIDDQPDDLETHVIKIAVLRKLGRSEEAVEIYRAAAEKSPNDPHQVFLYYEAITSSCRNFDPNNLENESFDEERYQREARPILDRVLELDPDSFEAWFELVSRESDTFGESRLNELATVIDKIPPPDSSIPDPYTAHNRRWRLEHALATHYLFGKRTEDAIKVFDNILKRYATTPANPNRYYPFQFHKVYLNYGVCLDQAGRLEEAEAVYRKSLSINPMDLFSIWNLALAVMKKGDYKSAHYLFEKCEQIDPSRRDLKGYIGLCLLQLGRRDEGIALMKQEAVSQGGENQWTKRLGNEEVD